MEPESCAVDDIPSPLARKVGSDALDECSELSTSLELALGACLAQLRALRGSVSAAPSGSQGGLISSPEFAAEERALKLTVSSLIAQLQDMREAGKTRRRALLLAVTPQLLPLLPTASVLKLAAASSGLRSAAAAGGGTSGKLLVPRLDAAPACPEACRKFLSEIALGSVRSASLPAAPTLQLLAERSCDLGALEALLLPAGVGASLGSLPVPRLPSLRNLTVYAGAGDFSDTELRSEGAAWLQELIASLPRALSSFELEALDSGLAAPLLEVALRLPVSQATWRIARRLIFKRCALPDAAVALICRALLDADERAAAPPLAVHFEECELSELAEQHLLAALEQCDGRCVVSMDGGTTRQSSATDAAQWFQAEASKGVIEETTTSPRDSMATELARLQSELAIRDLELARLRAELANRDALPPAAQSSKAFSSSCASAGKIRSPVATEPESVGMPELLELGLLRLCEEGEVFARSRAEGRAATRSRFGFVLDDEQEEEGVAMTAEGQQECSSVTLSSLD